MLFSVQVFRCFSVRVLRCLTMWKCENPDCCGTCRGNGIREFQYELSLIFLKIKLFRNYKLNFRNFLTTLFLSKTASPPDWSAKNRLWSKGFSGSGL